MRGVAQSGTTAALGVLAPLASGRGRRRRRVAASSLTAHGRPAGVGVLWRLFLLLGLLHEARDRAAFDSRRGVLRRRAMGAHALLLQPVRGSSKYANRLRFAIARLASIQIDPSPALTVYLLSYNYP